MRRQTAPKALPQPVDAVDAVAPGAFVGKLVEWQTGLGMSDRAFARHLGISPAYWSLLRRGRRPAGFGTAKVVRRVLREKPELEFYLAADFRARYTDNAKVAKRV